MIEDELLRAVIENPDDDGPRLVYADALLQAGDPRGELITAQCHPDKAVVDGARVAELAPVWQQLLGDAVSSVTLERGFPATVELCILQDDHDTLVALDRAPIRRVILTYADDEDPFDPELAAWCFARDPRTARIRALELAAQQTWGEQAFRTLLAADLRSLGAIAVGDGDAATYAIEAILGNPAITFETLEFYGGYDNCNGDLSAGLPLLLASPRIATLRDLAVSKCSLDTSACELIARSPLLANLVALDLTGTDYISRQEVGDVGLESLAQSPHLGSLARLEIGGNEISDDGIVALAQSQSLAHLVRLGLDHSQVTDDGLAALAGALPELRSLTLTDNPITASGIAKLVATHPLEELYVGGCALGDAGVIAIAGSPHARRLRCLNLHIDGFGAAAVDALVASPIEHLEFLVVPRIDPALRALLVERFGAALR